MVVINDGELDIDFGTPDQIKELKSVLEDPKVIGKRKFDFSSAPNTEVNALDLAWELQYEVGHSQQVALQVFSALVLLGAKNAKKILPFLERRKQKG